MSLTRLVARVISNIVEISESVMLTIKRLFPALAGIFAKRLELCCPGGARNETVDRVCRDGLHFGRLR